MLNKAYNQKYTNIYQINSQNKVSNKILLDSISNYLIIPKNNWNSPGWPYRYSSKRKIFSFQLYNNRYMNEGYISIDTINKSIRFNYTGETGSGGFAPYTQQTFNFQDFSSFNWVEKDEKIILHISSHYDFCDGDYKPIAEIEVMGGCKNSEDKVGSMPDYTVSFYSEYEIVYFKDDLSIDAKIKFSYWLNELLTR